jgi:hydroxypyruvate reductase
MISDHKNVLTDTRDAQVANHVIATARQSLQAAANFIASQGYTPIILGDTITGEAHDVASVHAAIAREIILHQHWAKLPVALISGGECTVTIPAEMKGRGGRCSEFLLALFAATSDLPNISALAADTDGIDGSEFNAGAWFTPAVRKLAKERNLNPTTFLMKHDCYGFFAELNALVDTGPTLTNVNDFRIILLEKN